MSKEKAAFVEKYRPAVSFRMFTATEFSDRMPIIGEYMDENTLSSQYL